MTATSSNYWINHLALNDFILSDWLYHVVVHNALLTLLCAAAYCPCIFFFMFLFLAELHWQAILHGNRSS